MIEVNVFCLSRISNYGIYEGLLNDEERKKCDVFRNEVNRNQYIIGRGFLRYRLAELGVGPAKSIVFDYSDFNKPFVKGSHIHFNISHSREQVLVAFSDQGNIGVDVEFMLDQNDLKKLAERNFSDLENMYLNGLPGSSYLDGFYSLWTKKEAFIKAIGLGLQMPLQDFSVDGSSSLANLLEINYEDNKPEDWWIQELKVDPSYKAALCSQGRTEDLLINQHS